MDFNDVANSIICIFICLAMLTWSVCLAYCRTKPESQFMRCCICMNLCCTGVEWIGVLILFSHFYAVDHPEINYLVGIFIAFLWWVGCCECSKGGWVCKHAVFCSLVIAPCFNGYLILGFLVLLRYSPLLNHGNQPPLLNQANQPLLLNQMNQPLLLNQVNQVPEFIHDV